MSTSQPEGVSLNAGERRAVSVLALVFAVRMLGLFLLLPVLAAHAAHLPGGSAALAGLAVGAYGITQALLQIPFGMASDRFGRKPVIILGLAIFALGSLVAAVATSAVGIIAGRALQGAGAISAAVTALLADLTRPQLRTRALAVMGVTIGFSFVLSMIGGPLLKGWIGVPGIFVLTAVLALIGIALVAFAIPAPAPGTGRAARLSVAGLLAVLTRPHLLILDLGVLVLHFSLTAVFVVLPLSLQARLGLPVEEQWSLYLAGMLLSLAGTVPLVLASERGEKSRGALLVAIALVALGTVLLGRAAGGWWLITASLAVYFAGFNFLEARLPARLSGLVQAAERGAALGVFSSAQFFGAFLGGALGGLVYGRYGAGAVAGLSAAALLGWATLLLVSARPAAAEGG